MAPSVSFRSVRVASAALLFLAALLSAPERTDELAEPAPTWRGEPEVVPGWERLACVECHADVVDEWKSTLHALAWVDETYQDDLADKRRPQSCWGCHAPRPLAPDWPRKPKPRADERELGVTCETCHRGPDGTLLGPWGLPTDAHASVRSERFVGDGTIALCTSCHATTIGPVVGIAKDFEGGGERTCVGCHMRPKERVLADGSRRPGRSHALQTPRDPAFLARAFELELGTDPPTLRITNLAGHRIPGLVGRRIEFTIEPLAGGRPTGRIRHVVDDDAWLAAGASVAIPLALDGGETAVLVRGEHDDPRLARTVEFLVRELELR